MSATRLPRVALPDQRTNSPVKPSERSAADDAAYHRREVIRLTRRAGRLTGAAADAARAQADIHALLVTIAESGERIPDVVRDNLPAMVAWREVVE